jgi:hypothetical protein
VRGKKSPSVEGVPASQAGCYIADFEAALERSSAPAELIDRMTETHQNLANPYTLWIAAYDLLGTKT